MTFFWSNTVSMEAHIYQWMVFHQWGERKSKPASTSSSACSTTVSTPTMSSVCQVFVQAHRWRWTTLGSSPPLFFLLLLEKYRSHDFNVPLNLCIVATTNYVLTNVISNVNEETGNWTDPYFANLRFIFLFDKCRTGTNIEPTNYVDLLHVFVCLSTSIVHLYKQHSFVLKCKV